MREAGSRCLDTRGSWLAEEGRQTLGDEGLMDVTDGREGGVAEEQERAAAAAESGGGQRRAAAVRTAEAGARAAAGRKRLQRWR